MRGVTKASLYDKKHKQHSNTCGNESVHSLYTSFPRTVNYRTIGDVVRLKRRKTKLEIQRGRVKVKNKITRE